MNNLNEKLKLIEKIIEKKDKYSSVVKWNIERELKFENLFKNSYLHYTEIPCRELFLREIQSMM